MAEQIKFTEDIEDAIKDHSLHQIETQLVNKLEHYTNIDTSSEDPGNIGMEKYSIFCLFLGYWNIFLIFYLNLSIVFLAVYLSIYVSINQSSMYFGSYVKNYNIHTFILCLESIISYFKWNVETTLNGM